MVTVKEAVDKQLYNYILENKSWEKQRIYKSFISEIYLNYPDKVYKLTAATFRVNTAMLISIIEQTLAKFLN